MKMTTDPIVFGEQPLRIEQVVALASRSAPAQLQSDAAYREKIAKARASSTACWTRKA